MVWKSRARIGGGIEKIPVTEVKIAPDSARNVERDPRGLDDDRPRPAEGISKRAEIIKIAQEHHRRGERLL